MDNAEKNYQVIRQIEDSRHFLLEMYAHNPGLLKTADQRIRDLFPPAQATGNAQITKQRGISLIELIMFIIIVSVALAGILLVMNVTTRSSADPLIHKQALAIAESLLEEVELMPFTFCDPDDPAAGQDTTVSAAQCLGGAGGANDENKLPLGPETAASVGGAEGRYVSPPFDNVSDYHGFTMNSGNGGIKDITGNAVAALSGYSATVAVAQQALGAIPATESLLITVTVTGPDGTPVVVEGMRTRYAPNATP